MNKIYLPYPIELILKIIAWIVAILIDTIELIFTPFKRIGLKCSAVYIVLDVIFSIYVCLSFGLTIVQGFSLFGTLLLFFILFLCAVHLIHYVLVKICRPPFAKIIFTPVPLSFRRPYFLRRKYRYKADWGKDD